MTALYIHWPFCLHKCPYCDFNSHVRDKIDEAAWEEAFITALQRTLTDYGPKTLSSIYFGGGTPSLMPVRLVERLLDTAHKLFTIDAPIETTLEANPTFIEAEKLAAFKRAGINRVSIGVQALNQEDLSFLGREHNVSEALKALAISAELFDRMSFDLIYARPGQSLAAWENELKQALFYAKDHVSLYQLTIEKGTPFYGAYQKQAFSLPDETLAAEMYELTEALLTERGWHCYEVSNYAKPGAESRHNLNYWRYGEYIGIGPGAHGRVKRGEDRLATMAMHHPEKWLNAMLNGEHGMQQQQTIPLEEQVDEAVLMGLRMREGVNLSSLRHQLGVSLSADKRLLSPLTEEGLLILKGDKMAATAKGRLVLQSLTNAVLPGIRWAPDPAPQGGHSEFPPRKASALQSFPG